MSEMRDDACPQERRKETFNAQRSTSNEEPVTHDTNGMAMPRANHEHEPEMHMSMQSSINIADPMSRESSGTAWVPDSTPMYGHMMMFGDDMLMLHGAIFPRYTNVSTRRAQLDHGHVFASARRFRTARFARDDESRSAHRRRARLSASLSNRRVVERSIAARSATSARRSEEHTSELQSLRHLVCR